MAKRGVATASHERCELSIEAFDQRSCAEKRHLCSGQFDRERQTIDAIDPQPKLGRQRVWSALVADALGLSVRAEIRRAKNKA